MISLKEKDISLIIDFDSTLVSIEILEELAKLALKENTKQTTILKQIAEITAHGMDGTIPFDESLRRRLKLAQIHKNHIERFRQMINNSISPSVKHHADFFKANSDRIYIVSGGFESLIFPVSRMLGVKDDQVFANRFKFGPDGYVIGLEDSPLLFTDGKSRIVRSLCLDGTVIMVGEGMTDYAVRKSGAADRFVLYTEIVHRDQLVPYADTIVKDFDELLTCL